MKEQNYTNLDSQYNEFLERHAPNIGDAPSLKPPIVPYQIPSTSPDRIDPPLSPPPYSSMGNNTLKGFLQSIQYSPHSQGFRLDGLNGTVEFNQLFAAEIGIAAPDNSVPFVESGLLEGDVNALYFDPVNRLLGIGISIPSYNLHVNGTAGFQRPTVVISNNYNAAALQSNTLFQANGSKTLNLPAVQNGVFYSFYLATGGIFTVKAQSGEKIRIGNIDSNPGGFVTASTTGSVLTLCGISGIWVATSLIGDWASARHIKPENSNDGEMVTVTEFVNVTLADTKSLFESVTVTESVTMLVTNRSSVNDTVTVTESVTLAVI